MSLTLSDSNIAEIHELIETKCALRVIALRYDLPIETVRGMSLTFKRSKLKKDSYAAS